MSQMIVTNSCTTRYALYRSPVLQATTGQDMATERGNMAWLARTGEGEKHRAAWELRLPGEPDDATLVTAAQADPHAFALLYDRYVRTIYRYCYTRLGTHEAAEDATAEVFLKAFKALKRYRHDAFAAWLFRIARNVTTDMLRRQRPTTPLHQATMLPDPARSPDEITLAHSEATAVRTALATLSEEQRAALELQLAGWSGPEIATALARSPEAIRMLRLRAFNRLRRLLG